MTSSPRHGDREPATGPELQTGLLGSYQLLGVLTQTGKSLNQEHCHGPQGTPPLAPLPHIPCPGHLCCWEHSLGLWEQDWWQSRLQDWLPRPPFGIIGSLVTTSEKGSAHPYPSTELPHISRGWRTASQVPALRILPWGWAGKGPLVGGSWQECQTHTLAFVMEDPAAAE